MISYSYSPPNTSMVSLYEGDSQQRYRQYLKDSALFEHGAGIVANIVRESSREQTNFLREISEKQTSAIQEQTSAIQEASRQQVEAIEGAAQMMSSSIRGIGGQISDIVQESVKKICGGISDVEMQLKNLNRRMDMQIEQQKLNNYLLENIVDLLRIPNSEKERQHAITLGVKFFVNAAKSPILYADALEMFLKAESLYKQDYFVLHRIGCIYMYVDSLLNIEKASDYFVRAARYAEVECEPDAFRLANILTSPSGQSLSNEPGRILLLAADSYEKAAFASYVMDDVESAIDYQKKAVQLDSSPQNKYNLSKYLSHQGNIDEALQYLEEAIDQSSLFAVAVFQEADMVCRPEIINYLDRRNAEIDDSLRSIIDETKDERLANTVSEVLVTGSFVAKNRILQRVQKYRSYNSK